LRPSRPVYILPRSRLSFNLEAGEAGTSGNACSELPKIRELMKKIQLLFPIPILIALLALEFTPFIAAFYSICATIVLSWLRKDTRMGPKRSTRRWSPGPFLPFRRATVGVIGDCDRGDQPYRTGKLFSTVRHLSVRGHLFLVVLLIIIAGILSEWACPLHPHMSSSSS